MIGKIIEMGLEIGFVISRKSKENILDKADILV